MRAFMIRLAACVAGLIMFCFAFAINELGTDLLAGHLWVQGEWAHSSTNWPIVVGWREVGAWFYRGYPVTVGLTTVFLFWGGWPSEAARIILYILILAVVGPLTYINYIQSDQWLNLWVQSAFNIFVAFVGYAMVLKIRSQRPRAAIFLAYQFGMVIIKFKE